MPDVIPVKRMIITAVDKYDAELAAKGVDPRRCDVGSPVPDDATAYSHLRWMCTQIREFAQDERFDKCNRWLGFMQGSLWMLKHNTIDSFREDNTEEGEGFEPPAV